MRLLVTGGCGFVGANLVRVLTERGLARVARAIAWMAARLWRWVHASKTGRAARGAAWALIRTRRRTRRLRARRAPGR